METLTREQIDKRKWKSRTFWLVVGWVTMVPLSIVASVLIGPVAIIPIGSIVTWAGTVTALFMGGEKVVKAIRTKNGAK